MLKTFNVKNDILKENFTSNVSTRNYTSVQRDTTYNENSKISS